MIKYAVMTASFEFDPESCVVKEIFDDFTENDADENAKRVGIYDTFEEARAHLSTLPVSTTVHNKNHASANVAYIQMANFEWDNALKDWKLDGGYVYKDFTAEEIPENLRWMN